jgi:hypothetical protein
MGPIELLQLSLQLQGRTFGAPGLTALAMLAVFARHAREACTSWEMPRQGGEE